MYFPFHYSEEQTVAQRTAETFPKDSLKMEDSPLYFERERYESTDQLLQVMRGGS